MRIGGGQIDFAIWAIDPDSCCGQLFSNRRQTFGVTSQTVAVHHQHPVIDLSLIHIFAVVLGVWAVAFGALRLRDALRRRASGQPWGCCAGDAAVKFAVGIFMLASPLGSMAAWTVMVGLFFLFVGASVIFSAVYLDRLPHDFEDF